MNIEQLNERITQLTDLIASANDTIKDAEKMIKLAEQDRDRLADQRRESEPKFERVGKYEKYYSILFDGAAMICQEIDNGQNSFDDTNNFESNNYFKTVQRADEVANKINFLLKLERLHDVYCPNYVPYWDDGTASYIIAYDMIKKRYFVALIHACWTITYVYFPTREIAQEACDILNAELKEENERNCNE